MLLRARETQSNKAQNREYLGIFPGDVVAMHTRAITNMTYIT